MSGSRHRSRELAVQLCYQFDLNPASLEDPGVTRRFWREQAQASDDSREFFEFLVKGVAEHLPAIDRHIEKMLQNWKIQRVERTDLAVLRVAVFELLFSGEHFGKPGRPDDAVILDEAVELSKKFGNGGSPAFVNGVLDSLVKQSRMNDPAGTQGRGRAR